MRDGLYQVRCHSHGHKLVGVAHLAGRNIWGGNAAIYFVGSYELDGEHCKLVVTLDRHAQGLDEPFLLGIQRRPLSFSGVWDSNSADLRSVAASHPGEAEIQATLRFLSD